MGYMNFDIFWQRKSPCKWLQPAWFQGTRLFGLTQPEVATPKNEPNSGTPNLKLSRTGHVFCVSCFCHIFGGIPDSNDLTKQLFAIYDSTVWICIYVYIAVLHACAKKSMNKSWTKHESTHSRHGFLWSYEVWTQVNVTPLAIFLNSTKEAGKGWTILVKMGMVGMWRKSSMIVF